MISESISMLIRLQNLKDELGSKEHAIKQKQIIKNLMKEEAIENQIVQQLMEEIANAGNKEYTVSIEEFQEIERQRNTAEGMRGLFNNEIKQLRESLIKLSELLDEELKGDKNIINEETSIINSINDIVKKILSQKQQINSYLSIVKGLKYNKNKLRNLRMMAKIVIKTPLLPLTSVNLFNKELPKFYIQTEGLEHIPESGPCIIAAHHHHSLLDPSIMKGVIERPIFFIAATELFIILKSLGRFVRNAGMIPYTKDDTGKIRITPKFIKKRITEYNNDNKKSMTEVFKHLQAGDIIGIFPEGDSKTFFPTYKRPKDQEFLSPNSGYVSLSVVLMKRYNIDVPIIPVGFNYRGISIKLRAGTPIHITPDIKGMNEEQMKQYITEQSDKIFEIIKQLSSY